LAGRDSAARPDALKGTKTSWEAPDAKWDGCRAVGCRAGDVLDCCREREGPIASEPKGAASEDVEAQVESFWRIGDREREMRSARQPENLADDQANTIGGARAKFSGFSAKRADVQASATSNGRPPRTITVILWRGEAAGFD
jgi:hypothetical protein